MQARCVFRSFDTVFISFPVQTAGVKCSLYFVDEESDTRLCNLSTVTCPLGRAALTPLPLPSHVSPDLGLLICFKLWGAPYQLPVGPLRPFSPGPPFRITQSSEWVQAGGTTEPGGSWISDSRQSHGSGLS